MVIIIWYYMIFIILYYVILNHIIQLISRWVWNTSLSYKIYTHQDHDHVFNWLQSMVPSFSLCINLASVLNKTLGFARFIEVFQLKSTQPPLLRVVTVRPAQPSWTQKPNVGSGGGITWGLSSMGLNTAPVCSGPLVAKKKLNPRIMQASIFTIQDSSQDITRVGLDVSMVYRRMDWLKGNVFPTESLQEISQKNPGDRGICWNSGVQLGFFVLPAPEALRRCQFFTKWQLRTGESGPLLLSRRLRDGNLEREDLRLKMSTLLALVDRPYGSLNSHKLTSIKNLRIYGGSEGSLSPLLCTLGGKLALLKPAKSTSTVREKEHWVHHGSENWWVVAASQFQKVPTVVIIW